MFYKLLEWLSLAASALSFTAVTYTQPWTSSSMEFFAFLSVIFLCLSIPFKEQRFFLAPSTKFILLLIASSLLVFLSLEIKFFENFSLFLLYASGVIVWINSLAHKPSDFHIKYIYCIVFVGIFASFSIFLQNFDIHYHILSIWVADYAANHGRPYANFGQPNLASSLILSSLCCCLYLHYYKKISTGSLFFISIFLGFALGPPASKTAMLVLCTLLIASATFKDRHSFIALTLASASYALFRFTQPESRDLLVAGISTGRFELWKTMFAAIKESPWLGYGILNTRAAHFEVRELGITPFSQTIGNSHNLLLEFLVWFGIFIGGILCIAFIILIARLFYKNKKNHRTTFLILPLLIHSQLEYPLSYANFLFAFAFFLCMLENRKNVRSVKKAAPLFLIFFIGIFTVMIMDYKSLEINYTNLRFFNKGFEKAEKPEPIEPILLDITTGQFNFFIIENIVDEQMLNKVKTLTPFSPTLKNYQLITNYLKDKEDRVQELNYWESKLNITYPQAHPEQTH